MAKYEAVAREHCPAVDCGKPVKRNKLGHRMGWCDEHWPRRWYCEHTGPEWPCEHTWTNYGKGWLINGKRFDTLPESMRASYGKAGTRG